MSRKFQKDDLIQPTVGNTSGLNPSVKFRVTSPNKAIRVDDTGKDYPGARSIGFRTKEVTLVGKCVDCTKKFPRYFKGGKYSHIAFVRFDSSTEQELFFTSGASQMRKGLDPQIYRNWALKARDYPETDGEITNAVAASLLPEKYFGRVEPVIEPAKGLKFAVFIRCGENDSYFIEAATFKGEQSLASAKKYIHDYGWKAGYAYIVDLARVNGIQKGPYFLTKQGPDAEYARVGAGFDTLQDALDAKQKLKALGTMSRYHVFLRVEGL